MRCTNETIHLGRNSAPVQIREFFRMLFTIAIHCVVFIHLLWIIFIILGFPLFLYLNLARWRFLHLAAVMATVFMQVKGIICPLTYLEAYLKSKTSVTAVYPGSFIMEIIENVIYVEEFTLKIIRCLTALFLIAVVLSFWIRPIRKKTRESLAE